MADQNNFDSNTTPKLLKKKIDMEGLWGFSRLDSTGFAFRVSLKPARGKYKEVKTKYLNAQPIDSMRYLDLIKINPYSGEAVGLGWAIIRNWNANREGYIFAINADKTPKIRKTDPLPRV